MENQNDEKMKEDNLDMITMSLSISRKEFAEYIHELEASYGEMQCPLCKKKVWGILPREDSPEHAAIVTLPLPNFGGRGVWAYPVMCMECGYIASFATNHVSHKIRRG
ncbi:TPA: hypothetical protein NES34_001825 [Klebsiella pneumoniae]|uniref:hypothetical protein n=1 Tax=Klebsiella quasipneumoniae TaxID=1463165 RepID=UPI0022A4C4B9|nr:hypothetical protein [Klebsiella quasipneumoniae]HBW7357706.1 hypothetical protein [Klebsiella pneumoniae]MDH2670282.1 hypothetical protein [Klebsiella quasipneumoniae]HBW9583336.1 hypothetical protein [Klebsiella pneumoniae]HBY6217324.1 hypothetical protein [Klebsiella pneumoniae]HCE4089017.1 hypothetical protein [Klebsiella pneumoniae]